MAHSAYLRMAGRGIHVGDTVTSPSHEPSDSFRSVELIHSRRGPLSKHNGALLKLLPSEYYIPQDDNEQASLGRPVLHAALGPFL